MPDVEPAHAQRTRAEQLVARSEVGTVGHFQNPFGRSTRREPEPRTVLNRTHARSDSSLWREGDERNAEEPARRTLPAALEVAAKHGLRLTCASPSALTAFAEPVDATQPLEAVHGEATARVLERAAVGGAFREGAAAPQTLLTTEFAPRSTFIPDLERRRLARVEGAVEIALAADVAVGRGASVAFAGRLDGFASAGVADVLARAAPTRLSAGTGPALEFAASTRARTAVGAVGAQRAHLVVGPGATIVALAIAGVVARVRAQAVGVARASGRAAGVRVAVAVGRAVPVARAALGARPIGVACALRALWVATATGRAPEAAIALAGVGSAVGVAAAGRALGVVARRRGVACAGVGSAVGVAVAGGALGRVARRRRVAVARRTVVVAVASGLAVRGRIARAARRTVLAGGVEHPGVHLCAAGTGGGGRAAHPGEPATAALADETRRALRALGASRLADPHRATGFAIDDHAVEARVAEPAVADRPAVGRARLRARVRGLAAAQHGEAQAEREKPALFRGSDRAVAHAVSVGRHGRAR